MKKELKKRARKLRKEGESVGKISKILQVSKGSVSLWVRDIELTEEQKEKLKDNLRIPTKKKGCISYRRRSMGEIKWEQYQKERQKKKATQWRLNNPEKYVNRDQDIKIALINKRGGACEKCGYNKSIGALDFHHRDPSQKEFAISSVHRGFDKMEKETDKCDLICANCHREIHWELNAKRRQNRILGLKREREIFKEKL